MPAYIVEPERSTPVIAEADLCVAGGSCTGVFAAVRAARLGLRVVLIEKQNMLGGTAVCGLVNVWHSLRDTDNRNQIIAGLTDEVIERLHQKGAVLFSADPNTAYKFNPWELACILDRLIKEHKITVMLHTTYVAAVHADQKVQAVIVENPDGRGAVRAGFFIDATGGGRIARDLGIPHYEHDSIQPPSSCFHLMGETDGVDLGALIRSHGQEFGLADDWGWSEAVAGCAGITMRADHHVFHVRCDRAEELTYAEMEGRRQADAFVSMLRKYGRADCGYALTALCAHIGVRETVHYRTRFSATADALLKGQRYDAPVLNGTYRIDIHHSDDMGITFKYLDGREETFYGKNTRCIKGNWREKEGAAGEAAKFYQVPFDLLVAEEYDNFIAVGRMLNADQGAFGALRVMVNLNQLGEAAGVAAYLCVNSSRALGAINGSAVTETLRRGGSAL